MGAALPNVLFDASYFFQSLRPFLQNKETNVADATKAETIICKQIYCTQNGGRVVGSLIKVICICKNTNANCPKIFLK